MSNPDAYVALIASLPSSERLFASKLPPLSRLRLEKRLAVLTPEHRRTLDRIEQVLNWRTYAMDVTGQAAMTRVKALVADLESKTLRDILIERMDLRTTIVALRLRRRGDGPPAEPWGYSRLTRRITAHWTEPHFGLSGRMPWLPGFAALLDKQQPLAAERYMLDVTFRQLQRHGRRHLFDFEAVVIYVLKWNIFDRWARADARAAASRFEALAQTALSGFDDHALEEV